MHHRSAYLSKNKMGVMYMLRFARNYHNTIVETGVVLWMTQL